MPSSCCCAARAKVEGRSRSPILVRVPGHGPSLARSCAQAAGEYALQSELDPANVVRSPRRSGPGRPMLILEDPLGNAASNLSSWRDGHRAISEASATRLAAALAHVHSRGLVHKDIKPGQHLGEWPPLPKCG